MGRLLRLAAVVNAALEVGIGGLFIATPPQVGATEEEIIDFHLGRLDRARMREIVDALNRAAMALIETDPSGRC